MEEDQQPLELVDVIVPPPSIRRKIDVTANYVATRGGLELEAKIREGKSRDPSFSFLNQGDPYHAYYQKTVMDIKLGKVSVTDTEPMETAIKPKRVAKGPKEPPAFEFSSDTPSISAQDVDIIKLTAMFVARNGRQFMAQLAQREARNYQFDFLRPNHNLFGYFSELIQQYTKILIPNAEGQEKLKQNIEGRKSKLEACIVRMEWMKHLESSRKEKEEREKAEQAAYAAIDWHDFAVVQTLEFTENDTQSALPHPTTISTLQSIPLAQRAI